MLSKFASAVRLTSCLTLGSLCVIVYFQFSKVAFFDSMILGKATAAAKATTRTALRSLHYK